MRGAIWQPSRKSAHSPRQLFDQLARIARGLGVDRAGNLLDSLRRPARLEQLGHQAGPALVARAETVAGVAVKILIEEQIIAEVGIGLQFRGLAEDHPLAIFRAQEEARQAT